MVAGHSSISFLGDFISNEFHLPEEHDGEWAIKSPADLSDEVIRPTNYYKHIDQACVAASEAYKTWRYTSSNERQNYLLCLKKVYEAHAADLATVIARETGKPMWEAKTEAGAMAAKIAITLEHSMQLVAEERVTNALPGVEGVIRHKSRGVMAVVGPFNFPGHLPNGHIIPALATGNTVVFKPSDKTPAVGQLMAQLFQKAEFPPGVFNLLQGQGETGKRLVGHELVDGVLFTGSYDVGLIIKQETMTHYRKLLALEMGGKNCAVVWSDADLEKAVYENIIGAFLTSGQRCSCTSKIILHRDIKDKFVEVFYKTAKKLKIGHYNDEPFMGPLISRDSVDKFIRFQEIAGREGAESLMRGKALETTHEGHYVTPNINFIDKFDPKSVFQNCEIFGPSVSIFVVDDFDEAIAINNSTGFGLVMSVFTQSKELFDRALIEAKVGLVNWNRTTNGASSRLPFGGMGKSGNDRPSGHYAVKYCTVPVSSLEDMTKLDHSKIMPGIDYAY